jgi:hypothetical protein
MSTHVTRRTLAEGLLLIASVQLVTFAQAQAQAQSPSQSSMQAVAPKLPLKPAAQVNCAVPGVFCMDEFLALTQQNPAMERTIGSLPAHLRQNLTFKRGNNMTKILVGGLGPHGHKVSSSASGSASPEQPRAFVWDEMSGFTASWNSGNSAHTANDRVDLYDFDFQTNQHRLMVWVPQQGAKLLGADFADSSGQRCTTCHGQVQRPIFPMYPDWPQFYGEFNDEMTSYPQGALALRSDLRAMANDFQPRERRLYEQFVAGEGQSNPRYTPLFANRPAHQRSNPVYPFRPRTTTSPFSDVSRAFAYRPNLRLGVMYNRLTALQTFEKIKASAVFQEHPEAVFYSLLDCNWAYGAQRGEVAPAQILTAFRSDARRLTGLRDLDLRGVRFQSADLNASERRRAFAVPGATPGQAGQTEYVLTPDITDANYTQVPYEDLLKALGLQVADLDIRFRHDSSFRVQRGFNVYDPKAFYFTDSVMDIGYVSANYALNPTCDNRGRACSFTYSGTYMDGLKYFNSYFDGSATTNELIAAQLLRYLTDRTLDLSAAPKVQAFAQRLRQRVANADLYFETLSKKYSRFTQRLALDRPFFDKMDAIGPWIQLPYPPDLLNVHNRESFWSGGRTAQIRALHAQWLTPADRRQGRRNLNNGQNICWNVHSAMMERFRAPAP